MFAEKHNSYDALSLEGTPEIWAADESTREVDAADGVELLGMSSHGSRAVRQATTQRGVRESGGANSGVPLLRYVRYFVPGSGPLPWCAFFVSWCFDTTGDQNHRMPWDNAGYVGSIRSWAQATGRLQTAPQHGDIFGIGTEHTGLVAGSDPARRIIWTIEGNWGDSVAQRNLAWSGLWFARL